MLAHKLPIPGSIVRIEGNHAIVRDETGVMTFNLNWYRVLPDVEPKRSEAK